MTQSTKVRLVRCPKCRQLLPELPGIFLYRCGGCNTILQAKNRQTEANQNQLDSQTTDSTTEVLQDSVTEEQTGTSNDILKGPSEEESPPNKDNERHGVEDMESCSETSEYRSVSNELSFSAECNVFENKDSPREDSLNDGKARHYFGQFSEGYVELHELDGNSTGGSICSGELPSSDELCYHGIKELDSETSELMDQSMTAGQSNGIHTLGVPQGDNVLHEVQDFSKIENLENRLHVFCEHEEEMTIYQAHLDTDGVLEQGLASNHDITNTFKDKVSLVESNIRYPDKQRENSSELSAGRNSSYDRNNSHGVLCFDKKYSLVEESSNLDKRDHSLSQNSKKYDHKFCDSDDECIGVLMFSGELSSSRELTCHNTKELYSSRCTEEAVNALDQPIKVDLYEGDDGFQQESEHICELEDQKNKSMPVCSEYGEVMDVGNVHLDTDNVLELSEDRNDTLELTRHVSECRKDENCSLDQIAAVDNSDCNGFLQEYQCVCESEDKSNKFLHVDTEHGEEMNIDYVHLDTDDVLEAKKASLTRDLISPPKEESSLGEGIIWSQDEHNNSNVQLSKNGIVSSNVVSCSPEIRCFENGYSRVEESSNHANGNRYLDKKSRKYDSEKCDSDEEWIRIRNFSSESPSSGELLCQDSKELTAEDSECLEIDAKSYMDQHTQVEQTNCREFLGVLQESDTFHVVHHFSEHEAEAIELPSVFGEERGLAHTCDQAENIGVYEESTISNHDLTIPSMDESLLEKDNRVHRDEQVETATELHQGGSISNDLSSSYEVDHSDNKDIFEEKLTDLIKGTYALDQDSKRSRDEQVENATELHQSGSISKGLSCSYEVDQSDNKYIFGEDHTDLITGTYALDQDSKRHRDEQVENSIELHQGGSISNGLSSSYEVDHSDDKYIFEEAQTDLIKGIYALDRDSKRHRDEQVENATELHQSGSISNGTSSSYEVDHSDNKDIFEEEPIDLVKGTYALDQDSKRHDSDLDESEESVGDSNLSPEISSSIQLVYHENKEMRPKTSECMEENVNAHVNQSNKIDEYEREKCFEVFQEIDKFQCEARVFSDQDNQEIRFLYGSEHKEVLQDDFVHRHTDETSQNHFADQNVTIARVDLLSSETVCHQSNKASHSAVRSVEVDDVFESSPAAKNLKPIADDTIVASQTVLTGSDGSVNLTTANENFQDRFHRRGHQDFESASSLEFVGSSPVSDASHQLRVKHAGPTLSLISKYGYHYAYDSGESSNDGTDNPIHAHIPHPARRKGKDLYGVKNTVNNEPEMNLWVPSPLLGFQENQRHARGASPWKKNVFSDSKTHTHGYTGVLREATTSRLPFSSGDITAKQKNGKHSINTHSQPLSHTNLHSPENPPYYELDKMELLRTVCELKDQLNRIHLPEISREGMLHSEAMEETLAPHFDHLTPERDIYGDLNRPAYHLRYNQEKAREERANVSRLALSERVAYYKRHKINCPCSHCRDWKYSTRLPPPSRYRNDHSMSHIGHNRLQIFNSSNPVDYTSDFSVLGQESELDRQRHRDDEMKRIYLRDKYHTSKKVLRPVAGGSPFVSCYHCSELLQLPADFLLFEKRYHQLRCSACLKVLKFFLTDGMHIIPCLPEVPASNKSGNIPDGTFQENQVPMPQSIYCQHGDSFSCSDDYGPSFSRSYSTEVDAVPMLPFGLNQRNRYSNSREKSSGSYFEAIGDKKMKSTLKESTSYKKRDAGINFASVGTSSGLPQLINATSEIEEIEPLTKSPLHQLMGYRTPSQVFKR